MTDLFRVKATRILTSCTFWISIVVFYFQSRDLSTEQVFQLVSLYSIAIVVFEYPTGVIGDFFSHKTSVTLGYLVTGISVFILGFDGSYLYYIFVLLLGALGISLISGSDTAVLHSVSKDFDKDYSD